jgi:hypothetical protein
MWSPVTTQKNGAKLKSQMSKETINSIAYGDIIFNSRSEKLPGWKEPV